MNHHLNRMFHLLLEVLHQVLVPLLKQALILHSLMTHLTNYHHLETHRFLDLLLVMDLFLQALDLVLARVQGLFLQALDLVLARVQDLSLQARAQDQVQARVLDLSPQALARVQDLFLQAQVQVQALDLFLQAQAQDLTLQARAQDQAQAQALDLFLLVQALAQVLALDQELAHYQDLCLFQEVTLVTIPLLYLQAQLARVPALAKDPAQLALALVPQLHLVEQAMEQMALQRTDL